MRRQLFLNIRRGFMATLVFFVLCGLAYPLAETGIGQALFSHQVNGSLTAQGSTIIGQTWSGPKWFQGRPDSDDPMATGGSNLGPRSKVLVKTVQQEVAKLKKEGINPTADLVTTSGSAVDPDISPADAYAQVNAVAKARHLPVPEIRHLVATHVHSAQYGFLGASYVDVLELNLALDKLAS